MPTLVIKSFPEDLHAKLRQIAASHRRSVTQETIHLLEKAISTEEKTPPASGGRGTSYWANRKLLPEYEALLNSGARTPPIFEPQPPSTSPPPPNTASPKSTPTTTTSSPPPRSSACAG